MSQTENKRLEAIKMWIWRRTEKISWVDKINKEEVLQKVNETRTMLDTLGKHRHVWLEHGLRHGITTA